ncbi:helix-turn-helix domain-containing protein [Microbacterium sp. lyk4-40-TSB-66]|uniref:PucR family transcriptional regulator n=1 Tax=Microbacterium sp. lyk4-40-TSB-66 TaxID=3040294 RepID=UPI00254BFF32|nr:helix-turn-helix domain-containing protein [Microbacterium sp. lyk4-40-TSB-66]
MAQLTTRDLLAQTERLGVAHAAGPEEGAVIARVEVTTLADLPTLPAGALAVVAGDEPPAPYLVDVALRQASARGLAGLVMPTGFSVTETAAVLAARGGVPVLVSLAARAPDLAVAIDRVISGGAAESMTRAAFAVEKATQAAAAGEGDAVPAILDAAGTALGVRVSLREDLTTSWTDADAVFAGEVPIGRLVAETSDPAATVALPVVASLVSRAMQRHLQDRFAPNQSRADLIVELMLAEAGRVDGFVAPAARLGLPLQLSHAVAWMRPQHRTDPGLRAPRFVEAALELFTLQLIEDRPELWHIAFLQDDVLVVSSEDHGAGDHQRRLRDVISRVQAQARRLVGDDWTYTVGLGTPQTGAAGLRQSAAEARVAADSAIAGGRLDAIELTDVTGLRRLLLDFYASPVSRNLLDDILHPLDVLGSEKSITAVRTLLSYLGNRNSLAQAGRELNLHPNAVGYRIRRARELLDVDLDDPDTRFAVELACRVRLLGTGR